MTEATGFHAEMRGIIELYMSFRRTVLADIDTLAVHCFEEGGGRFPVGQRRTVEMHTAIVAAIKSHRQAFLVRLSPWIGKYGLYGLPGEHAPMSTYLCSVGHADRIRYQRQMSSLMGTPHADTLMRLASGFNLVVRESTLLCKFISSDDAAEPTRPSTPPQVILRHMGGGRNAVVVPNAEEYREYHRQVQQHNNLVQQAFTRFRDQVDIQLIRITHSLN